MRKACRTVAQMYDGPPTLAHVWQFVNAQCSRAAHVGRVYVADILAAQFVAASTAERRSRVLDGLRHLRWQYAAGREKAEVQRYFRYYLDIMEVRPLAVRSRRPLVSQNHCGEQNAERV
jgi:hypothetical protein